MSAERMIPHGDAIRVTVSVDVPLSLAQVAGPVVATPPSAPPVGPLQPLQHIYVVGDVPTDRLIGMRVRGGYVVSDMDDDCEEIRSVYHIAERGITVLVTDAHIYLMDQQLVS